MSIEVRDLTHIYNEGLPHESVAVKDVSFDIADGEIVGIIGHTGSGKSTLVQHLNGLIKPTSGSVVVDGKDITKDKSEMFKVRRKVGLVFQYPEYQLFEETLAKDIAFGPKNIGIEEDEIETRVRDAMAIVGLDYDEFSGKSPFDLSGGQKRKAAIAGIIAMEPSTLILDEPTAGLDPRARKQILKAVMDIHEKLGSSIVIISHNMTDIANMCGKIIVMDKGEKMMEGTPKEVFSQRTKLEAVGLSIPPALAVIDDLKKKGFGIDRTPFTAKDAADAIYEVIKG